MSMSSAEAFLVEQLTDALGFPADELAAYVAALESDEERRAHLSETFSALGGDLRRIDRLLAGISEREEADRRRVSAPVGDGRYFPSLAGEVTAPERGFRVETAGTQRRKRKGRKDRQSAASVGVRKHGTIDARAAADDLGMMPKKSEEVKKGKESISSSPSRASSSKPVEVVKEKRSSWAVENGVSLRLPPGEGDVEEEKEENGRRGAYCACMGTLHGLYGNCLRCGKILCDKEAGRECTYCGGELGHIRKSSSDILRCRRRAAGMTDKQVSALVAERARASQMRKWAGDEDEGLADGESLWEKQRREKELERPTLETTVKKRPKERKELKEIKAWGTTMAVQADTTWGDDDPQAEDIPAKDEDDDEDDDGLIGMEKEEDEDMKRAKARRDRLLEYDQTQRERSTVFDDQADYFRDASSAWLSADERAEAQARDEARRRAMHVRERGQKLSITLGAQMEAEIERHQLPDAASHLFESIDEDTKKRDAQDETDTGARLQGRAAQVYNSIMAELRSHAMPTATHIPSRRSAAHAAAVDTRQEPSTPILERTAPKPVAQMPQLPLHLWPDRAVLAPAHALGIGMWSFAGNAEKIRATTQPRQESSDWEDAIPDE